MSQEEIFFLLDVINELHKWITQRPNEFDVEYNKIEEIEKKYNYKFDEKTYNERRKIREEKHFKEWNSKNYCG